MIKVDFTALEGHKTGVPLNNGIQHIFEFSNGLGASVVQHEYSYGGRAGKWELAVLKFDDKGDWNLTYETEITNDVLGHLEESEVVETLTQIQGL